MLDGAMPLVFDVDDLAMAATDLLDQFRDRGIEDSVQRKLVGLIRIMWKGSTPVNGLIAKFGAAIKAHDAKVADAQKALEERAAWGGRPSRPVPPFGVFPFFAKSRNNPKPITE